MWEKLHVNICIEWYWSYISASTSNSLFECASDKLEEVQIVQPANEIFLQSHKKTFNFQLQIFMHAQIHDNISVMCFIYFNISLQAEMSLKVANSCIANEI